MSRVRGMIIREFRQMVFRLWRGYKYQPCAEARDVLVIQEAAYDFMILTSMT